MRCPDLGSWIMNSSKQDTGNEDTLINKTLLLPQISCFCTSQPLHEIRTPHNFFCLNCVRNTTRSPPCAYNHHNDMLHSAYSSLAPLYQNTLHSGHSLFKGPSDTASLTIFPFLWVVLTSLMFCSYCSGYGISVDWALLPVCAPHNALTNLECLTCAKLAELLW